MYVNKLEVSIINIIYILLKNIVYSFSQPNICHNIRKYIYCMWLKVVYVAKSGFMWNKCGQTWFYVVKSGLCDYK